MPSVMNSLFRRSFFASVSAFAVFVSFGAGSGAAEVVAPSLVERAGYVDFGEIAAPSSGGQHVEVSVQGALLSLAARVIEREEPAVAALVRGLHAVRVNVVSIDETNRESLERTAAAVRETLDARGWNRVATVRDGTDNVAVFLKTGAGDAIEGLVVTVLQRSGEAVFVNVVGDIVPEQLAVLGDRLGIDPLRDLKVQHHSGV
jgi:hypothetical protein